MNEWNKPVGKNMSFKDNCIGIYISRKDFEIYKKNHVEELKIIINHPLYKGILEGERENILENVAKLAQEKNNNTIYKLKKLEPAKEKKNTKKLKI